MAEHDFYNVGDFFVGAEDLLRFGETGVLSTSVMDALLHVLGEWVRPDLTIYFVPSRFTKRMMKAPLGGDRKNILCPPKK